MSELLEDPSFSRSKTFHWLDSAWIPAAKLGGTWTASKTEIRAEIYGRLRARGE
jgi:hypothetical protein